MRFHPTLPSAARAERPGAEAGVADDPAFAVGEPNPASDGAPAAREFAPYDPEALAARHRDDLLQSLATPEALEVSLRRLDEQARAGRDEQGVNTLFQVFRAPLVLLPVQLARRSARAGHTVEATDEEPLVNPALAEHLRRTCGLTLPDLPADDDATPAALQRFYADVAELAAERARAGVRGWAVRTEIALGLFAFQKLVMFNNLEANHRRAARRPGFGGALAALRAGALRRRAREGARRPARRAQDERLDVPPAFDALRPQVSEILRKLAGSLEIRNANERRTITTRRKVLDSEDFRGLWDRIKHRTTYRVQFDNEQLVRDCVDALKAAPRVAQARVQVRKASAGAGSRRRRSRRRRQRRWRSTASCSRTS